MSEHKQLKWNGDKSMPIGEDVPMLIPVSIVLVVFVLFLFSLFTGFGEKSEIVRMSQVSLNVGEYIINAHPRISAEFGMLNGTYLYSNSFSIKWARDNCPNNCKNSSARYLMNFSSSYPIAVKIEAGDSCWCWEELKTETVVVNTFPVLILNNSKTIPAKVVVSVGK